MEFDKPTIDVQDEDGSLWLTVGPAIKLQMDANQAMGIGMLLIVKAIQLDPNSANSAAVAKMIEVIQTAPQ